MREKNKQSLMSLRGIKSLHGKRAEGKIVDGVASAACLYEPAREAEKNSSLHTVSSNLLFSSRCLFLASLHPLGNIFLLTLLDRVEGGRGGDAKKKVGK